MFLPPRRLVRSPERTLQRYKKTSKIRLVRSPERTMQRYKSISTILLGQGASSSQKAPSILDNESGEIRASDSLPQFLILHTHKSPASCWQSTAGQGL